MYTSKLKSLYTAFLHSIKFPGYRVGINFNTNSVNVKKKKKYLTKIVNVYIVYDLNDSV